MMMNEPDFMAGLETMDEDDIKDVLKGISERQKLEMVTYVYMNVIHKRYGEDVEYAGAKDYIYNEMTLYDPQANIDRIMDDEVAKYLQAPERSGKTLQILWNAILNVHLGRCGLVMIGSPKDNVAGVAKALNDGLVRFQEFINAHYKNINKAFGEVFGKNMLGIDRFIHMDGNSKVVDLIPTFKDKKTGNRKPMEHYYAIAEILSGSGIPVFSSTSRPPVEKMKDLIKTMRDPAYNVDHFLLLDEADSVIKPTACGSTEMSRAIQQVIGMSQTSTVQCPNCPATHECLCLGETNHPGSYGGAKKIVFLSATMNLVVNYMNTIPGPRIMVAPPITQRAQTLMGGVDNYEAIPINEDNASETLKDLLMSYITTKNPVNVLDNFKFHLKNTFIVDDPEYYKKYDNGAVMDNMKTGHRPLKHFNSDKPFMRKNAYCHTKRKTNSSMMVHGSPFVNGIGNKKNVLDEDMVNQVSMINFMFNKLNNIEKDDDIVEKMDEDAMAISFFSGGAKMWFQDGRYHDKGGASVTDIIRDDNLEEQIIRITTYSKQQEAMKIIQKFRDDDEDIANTMKFVSWYYGLHVPIVVFGFNKALRAVDTRDRHHIITHQFIISTDGHGADDVKQIAGRSKASKGELLAFNFDVSHENSEDNFKVTIACNKDLADSRILENKPFQNTIENGKRMVEPDVLAVSKKTSALPKAARKHEDKPRNLMAIGEEDEIVVPAAIPNRLVPNRLVLKLNTIEGKLSYYCLTEAENRLYTNEELTSYFIALRTNGKVTFANDGRIWVSHLRKKHIISQQPGNLFSINKHVPFDTTGSL